MLRFVPGLAPLVLLASCGVDKLPGESADGSTDDVTLLDAGVVGKETTVEHCDGEDNDGDGSTDEGCSWCDFMVTRGRTFYTNNTCVLTGGGSGINLMPVTLGSTTYSTTTDLVNYLNTSAGSNATIRLGQQLVIARFNTELFFLGEVEYHDWQGDGNDETVDELITLAESLYVSGTSSQKNSMATLLQTLNAEGTATATWFDSACLRPAEICNGVDDDADGSTDESCGCYEVCDGYDNDDDGVTDPSCSSNTAPTITSVTVMPGTLYTNTDAGVTAAGSDADGDTLTWRYQWYVNGSAVSGQTGMTFSSTYFNKGDTVRVDAWVSDGTAETGPTSASSVVANSAPVAPTVTLGDVAETYGFDGLQCSYGAATDADGDALSYTLGWTVDSVAFTDTGTVSVSGDYVNNRDLARGQDWVCTVTVSDGTSTASGTATNTETGPAEGGYAFETVAYVDFPSDIAVLPSGYLLVSDLLGGMHLVDPETGVELASANPLDENQELLAFVLHPDYGDGTHDWAYLWASKWGDLYRFDFDEDTFTFTNGEMVLDLDATNTDGHCGGGLQFWDGETGADLLYVGTGPMNGADAQAGDNPGKKILALEVDPITGDVLGAGLDPSATDDTVAAYGTRNPWRITDCGSVLCFGDPGVSSYEEVNLYGAAGQNFGHPDQEGPADGAFAAADIYWGDDEETQTNADPDGSTRETFANVPFVSHRFSGNGYGGRLEGYIFYGDFYDGWVQASYINDLGEVEGSPIPVAHQTYLMKFVETADGTVYAIELGGSIKRLIYRADRATVGEVGEALSSTAWSSATTYTPRYTLWSNGADKTRKIYIPSGTEIDNTDSDDWVWPDGTRIYKDFSLSGVLIETRVLAKEDGEWIPGVYLWNSGGTEAYLSEGYSHAVPQTTASGYNYVVPSTELCRECHESERGAEWPLSTTPYRMGNSAMSSVSSMLSVAPTAVPESAGTANTRRVRGYLDVNCSFCHNPDGIVSKMSVIAFDLSYTATMDTSVVAQYYHANPNTDDGDPIFDVASPRDSVLYRVIRYTEMPPISVVEYDRSILNPLNTWIAAGAP